MSWINKKGNYLAEIRKTLEPSLVFVSCFTSGLLGSGTLIVTLGGSFLPDNLNCGRDETSVEIKGGMTFCSGMGEASLFGDSGKDSIPTGFIFTILHLLLPHTGW